MFSSDFCDNFLFKKESFDLDFALSEDYYLFNVFSERLVNTEFYYL